VRRKPWIKSRATDQDVLCLGASIVEAQIFSSPDESGALLPINAHNQEPRVITVHKNAAYPKAINEFKAKEELH